MLALASAPGRLAMATTSGLPVGCLWAACGLHVGCLWVACGVPVGCLWAASGLPVGCLWVASGSPLGCLWVDSGLPLGCLWVASGCRRVSWGATAGALLERCWSAAYGDQQVSSRFKTHQLAVYETTSGASWETLRLLL